MMNRWKIYKLSDIADVQTGPFGSQLHQRDYVDVGTPCIMPCNIGANLDVQTDNIAHLKASDIIRLNKYCVKEGDIIYSRRGDIEKCAYINHLQEGWLCGTGCLRIRPNTSICFPKYLAYLLSTKESKKWIVANAVGTTMLNLNSSILNTMPISLPPLAEQKRIADILSAIDDKIELNRRINANLEQQAQALYKSWFVDFEPFGGKMPEDWRVGTISNIVDLLNGFAFKSSDFVEKGLYKLITIKGVQDGNMSLDGADCLDIIPPKMPQWCKLKKEDILLSLTGNVGRCCLVDTENCLLNQRVAKLHPKEEYNRLFVYALFRQEDMKARMISIARGTAQMNLSPIETGKLPLIIPSNEVLKDFGNRFNNIIHTLTNNIVESSYLAQLRDTLLPKLMSGEIKV